MRKRLRLPALAVLIAAAIVSSQAQSMHRSRLALPDIRGAGGAQRYMDVFNNTVWERISRSDVVSMVPKSLYPFPAPNRPEDFGPRHSLAEWSAPPAGAHYLAFGYTAIRDGRLLLLGWLYDAPEPDPSHAQVFGKIYITEESEDGARRLAVEFAADILRQLTGTSRLPAKRLYRKAGL